MAGLLRVLVGRRVFLSGAVAALAALAAEPAWAHHKPGHPRGPVPTTTTTTTTTLLPPSGGDGYADTYADTY